jgi:hypothetical protein
MNRIRFLPPFTGEVASEASRWGENATPPSVIRCAHDTSPVNGGGNRGGLFL